MTADRRMAPPGTSERRPVRPERRDRDEGVLLPPARRPPRTGQTVDQKQGDEERLTGELNMVT
jgi:hypothetical protein